MDISVPVLAGGPVNASVCIHFVFDLCRRGMIDLIFCNGLAEFVVSQWNLSVHTHIWISGPACPVIKLLSLHIHSWTLKLMHRFYNATEAAMLFAWMDFNGMSLIQSQNKDVFLFLIITLKPAQWTVEQLLFTVADWSVFDVYSTLA